MKDKEIRAELAALYQELQLASVVKNWDAVYGVGVRLSALRAALEANPPLEAPRVLAEVEGWAWPDLAAWNDEGEWILDLVDTQGDENRIYVIVTIRGKP